MLFNLIIAGVGGQGTVLASKLIAAAAMKKGFNVRTTETIGMAQRGGTVFGHVRIGENIFSPLIPLGKADALIAFECAEAVRQLHYLNKDGAVIMCGNPVNPAYEAAVFMNYLKSKVNRLITADCLDSGFNTKTLNVFLLGAAVQSGIFPFDAQTLEDVLKENLSQRILEMNLNAFQMGRKTCK
ncbi:MAG: indolepyruvate oxidoreductase subunit beta [Treponema sp.]|jgi:indolepyruvate ferredoxin oxidoreductase beta subunit|nr:indolepyruvate oxidoreductase subunit beta [Treponema sp.]